MGGSDEDLASFLQGFGFSEEELNEVTDELNSYRSIPGTTLFRYLNRIVSTIENEDRNVFLKGLMAGMAVKMVADAVSEPDLTEEERRIAREIEKLRFGR